MYPEGKIAQLLREIEKRLEDGAIMPQTTRNATVSEANFLLLQHVLRRLDTIEALLLEKRGESKQSSTEETATKRGRKKKQKS